MKVVKCNSYGSLSYDFNSHCRLEAKCVVSEYALRRNMVGFGLNGEYGCHGLASQEGKKCLKTYQMLKVHVFGMSLLIGGI